MVALTGIEGANRQFRPIRLGLVFANTSNWHRPEAQEFATESRRCHSAVCAGWAPGVPGKRIANLSSSRVHNRDKEVDVFPVSLGSPRAVVGDHMILAVIQPVKGHRPTPETDPPAPQSVLEYAQRASLRAESVLQR